MFKRFSNYLFVMVLENLKDSAKDYIRAIEQTRSEKIVVAKHKKFSANFEACTNYVTSKKPNEVTMIYAEFLLEIKTLLEPVTKKYITNLKGKVK